MTDVIFNVSIFRIITELEMLKKEAAEVQRKMEETDTVMAEVDTVSQQYLPLSTSCSAMYFTLESLNQVIEIM